MTFLLSAAGHLYPNRMKEYSLALTITFLGLFGASVSVHAEVALPYPASGIAQLPTQPSIYFKHEVVTLTDPIYGTSSYHELVSPKLSIGIPQLNDWTILPKDQRHSLSLKDQNGSDVRLTIDCYTASEWAALDPGLIEQYLNSRAVELYKEEYVDFSVFAGDEFRAPDAVRTLKLADGSEITVLKRGRTKPFRIADYFTYNYQADKLDNNGNVMKSYYAHEILCAHQSGFVFLVRMEGEREDVDALSSRLLNFLIESTISNAETTA